MDDRGYLMIMEEEIIWVDDIDDDDIQSAFDGWIDIISLDDMTIYHPKEEKWHEIEKVNRNFA